MRPDSPKEGPALMFALFTSTAPDTVQTSVLSRADWQCGRLAIVAGEQAAPGIQWVEARELLNTLRAQAAPQQRAVGGGVTLV